MERSTLWYESIKELEGRHGAHVGIYFNFLRWCLFLNLVIGSMWAIFVVIPYAWQHGFSGAAGIIYFEEGTGPKNRLHSLAWCPPYIPRVSRRGVCTCPPYRPA